MSRPQHPAFERLQAAGRVMTRLGWLAVASVVLAILAIAGGLWALGRALLVSPTDLKAAAQSQTERIARFNDAFQTHTKQIAGRTMFYPPPAPPKEDQDQSEPAPQGPSPKPTRYAGPLIIAMIGDSVWFEDGRVLHAGDDTDEDLQVVEPRGPWSAVLRWREVEFEVPLFERTTEGFLERSQADEEE